MRQVARRLKDGRLELVEVPDPSPSPNMVAVRTRSSVISSGTERATLDVARKGLLGKARARPDQARQVLDRMRREGFRSTLELVRQRLEELGPLGYSASGDVIEVGANVSEVRPGQRVAIAGAGFANHAEINLSPALLCVPIPKNVSDEDAAFATLGAIAIQGFRRSGADLGSTVAVIGLGLIGQLAVRVANAAGCRVIAIDLEDHLVTLARSAGVDGVSRAHVGAEHHGTADAVLICASTSGNDPVELAAQLARDRATVTVVGDVGMDIPRGPFYEKELDLRLSRSYGPGRYDPHYELDGHDYPIGYVRWTEQRNMEAFLDLVAVGRVTPSELITHRFEFADAEDAFRVLTEERPVAILMSYGHFPPEKLPSPRLPPRRSATGRLRYGLIGPGRFATGTLAPGLNAAGFVPAVVASASGLSAESARRQLGFEASAPSADDIFEREDLDLVVIATQHDSHADLTARALRCGLPVYVEKPLALDWDELRSVRAAQLEAGTPLFVGFNRRFAPLAVAVRALSSPRLMTYRVNAGRLPPHHWTNDPSRGGGRLKGEGCHFIDFLCDQAGSDPVTVSASGFASYPHTAIAAVDNFQVQLRFADGSVGSVHYAADSPTGAGKERFETSAPDAYGVVDDFRRGEIWTGSRRRKLRSRGQDKGYGAQFAQIREVLQGTAEPPAPDGYYVATLATLAAARSLETAQVETVISSVAVGNTPTDPAEATAP